MATTVERRSANRFQIKLPLVVRWANGSAVGEALTESANVSSRGLKFDLPKNLQVGSPIEILMTLPNEITLAGPVNVHCLGRVHRLETANGKGAVIVAVIERYEFLRSNDSAA